MTLTTKTIEGTKPEAETILELQQKMGVPAGVPIGLMVFETSLLGKKVYACWSGGAVKNGKPHLTLIGRAALEALINLPVGDSSKIIFQELKLGKTPIEDKVRATIMRAEHGAKVCFIGDMAGELDGQLHKAFNVLPGTLKVSH